MYPPAHGNESLHLQVDDFDSAGTFLLTLDLREDAFDEKQRERVAAHFLQLVDSFLENSNGSLNQAKLLTETERRQLLVEWNSTDTDNSAGALLHELFEAQSARIPDAVAVVSDGRTVSYRELDRRANQLAHALRKRGVGADILVGLCLNRTTDMIVALLAVLKAGGAYVPLDPEYPADRLAFMLEDCGAKVLITEESLGTSLPPLPAVSEAIFLDSDAEAIAAESQDKPRSEVDPSNLAYAIYTSGSTGQPKAALLTHRGLLNLAVSEIRLYGIGPQSRVLQFASLSFDTSLSEIAMALCSGAALYVEERDTILPGPDLEPLPRAGKDYRPFAYSVGARHASIPVPLPAWSRSSWAASPARPSWPRAGRAGAASLTPMVLPRPPSPPPTLNTATGRCHHSSAGRYPTYGSTSLTRRSSRFRVGVPGELYIGGIGVARGYLSRPKLNAERFLPDPFYDKPGALMYRSGDFARWRADGQIEFIGRIDDQVKIRGFRIELGEIEAVLAEHPDVRQAAVHLWTVQANDVRIVACCVPAKAGVLAPVSLRKHLRARLPEYMVPQYFLPVEEIPLDAERQD